METAEYKRFLRSLKNEDLIEKYKMVKDLTEEALDNARWSESYEEGSLWAAQFDSYQAEMKDMEVELSYRRIEI